LSLFTKNNQMKKIVIVFGGIIGLIITGWMLYSADRCYKNPNYISNDLLGYAAMIITFSLIFVGIKTYRDKYNDGIISFGKAFRVGLYISLVAATMYVGVWLIDYYMFMPDWFDKYAEHCVFNAKAGGATAAELSKKTADLADLKEMYKSPFFVIIISYFEVLPVALVVALISALVLKRKLIPQTQTVKS
jgi:hypothetical protein